MKKTIATILCMLGLAASAEQLDHWELSSGSMTDGEWTLTVGRRNTEATGPAEKTYELWISGCTQTPSSPTLLDLGKPISEYDGRKYAITSINSQNNWMTSEQKAEIGRLALPTNANYKLGQYTFQNCVNLVEVKPFVSDCCTEMGRGSFQNCSQITNDLVVKVTTASTSSSGWEMFDGCSSIPSADLSQSRQTEFGRHFFYNCSSMTLLKLPAAFCQKAENTVGVFDGMTSLHRVEMHSSVDGFLNLFPAGTTALSEIHFYNCLPNESSTILKNIAVSQVVTTYLHDMTDEQLAAWAACTEGGELTENSTWSSAHAGAKAYVNRPLVVYAERHVQIAAGVNAVVVDGQNGTFTVSRGDDDAAVGDLVVNYTVSGEAVAGTHYATLSGSVTIPNGESNATLSVSGLYTGSAFEKELTVTLSAGGYTVVEGKESASISIIGGYRSVSVAKVRDANKQTGQVGIFRISRGDGDSTLGDLVVVLSYSGTATNGTTYSELPTSVTIPAGQTFVDVEILPLDDASVTDDSDVIITVESGLYTPTGEPATVTIVYGSGDWGCWHISSDGKKITDGVWEFGCTLKDSTLVSTGDAYRLDVGNATAWPSVVSPLDFSKGSCYEYGGKTYKIVNWSMQFGTVEGNGGKAVATPTAAGAVVGAVTLLDGAHEATLVERAFAGCANMVLDLKDFPKNIVTIGTYAFLGSSVSGALNAPNVTIINNSAFQGTAVTALTAPKLVKIGEYVFYNATGLKTVDLGPDKDCVLTTIGQYAFNGCTALESFTPFLPSGMDKLESRAVFMGCASLTNALVFKGSNLGEDYKGWGGTQMFRDCANIPSADLSESTITALRREVFYGCTSLKEVKLPTTFVEFGNPKTAIDSKTYYQNINMDPFDGCSDITLYINSGEMPVKNSNTDVTVPMNIPEVTEMVIGTNMTNLEASAFSKAEYSNLTKIKFLGAKPETISTNLFASQTAETITVHVPVKYRESWKSVEGVEFSGKNGTWTSGTTQKIHLYEPKHFYMLIY